MTICNKEERIALKSKKYPKINYFRDKIGHTMKILNKIVIAFLI